MIGQIQPLDIGGDGIITVNYGVNVNDQGYIIVPSSTSVEENVRVRLSFSLSMDAFTLKAKNGKADAKTAQFEVEQDRSESTRKKR